MTNVSFELQLVATHPAIEPFLAQLAAAVRGVDWPAVRGLQSPVTASGKLRRAQVDQLEPLLGSIASIAKKPEDVTIGFTELSGITWGQRPDRKTIFLGITLKPKDDLFEDPADCVRHLTHVARGMLRGGNVASAVVERFGDHGTCVPIVPIAESRRPLVLTSDAEVAAAYERPDDFWSAGWTVETFGDAKLVTRCQGVVAAGDVLRETQDHQWQMARAARPNRTIYSHPRIEPDEQPIYEEGDARIHPVGLEADTGIAHYACVLEPGAHIHGFEVYYLRSVVKNKRTADGEPVERVQVVFQKQWMAESERRPLLDIGVEVFYRSLETGELVAVTT